MTSFRVKTIESKAPLGERLRRAREKRRLSVDFLARRLSIGKTYIAAIENGEYWRLPGEVYGRHFVRAYAEEVGLPVTSSLSAYAHDYRLALSQRRRQPFTVLPKKTKQVSSFFSFMSPLRVGFALFFLVSFGYLSMVLWRTLTPPFLVVEEPVDQMMVVSPTIIVRGQAEQEARVSINGESVERRDDGSFAETLDLHQGLNTISVLAVKKHGSQRVIERQIYLREATSEGASILSRL